MVLQRFFLNAFLLLALMAMPVAPVLAADQTANTTTYIATDDLPPQLLSQPPAENSAAWLKEIKAVIEAQKHITKTERAEIKDEQHPRIELMTKVIGPNVTRERLPKTFQLLDRVMNDTRLITDADKQFWNSRRPYLTDSRVHLLVDPIDKNPAYPSGHTSSMRVLAEVLGQLYPEKLAALRERAEQIAWHRVEAGAHYPNDLEGGRMLAMLIVGALSQNDNFQDDLIATQQEIAQAK